MLFPSSCAVRVAVLAYCLFRSLNVTATVLNPVPSTDLIILFDQDLLHFDQTMWPMTAVPLFVFIPNLPFELAIGLWLVVKGIREGEQK
jgi:hypothetical protein